ncbi:RNA pseudouridine synthase [Acrasis kona]|uniref:RNA pseudouridine synthase n=1 Tax=Acrasis kona TaxID=1008807 RepID=A0AAW2Z813_9EUKA
MFNFFTTRLVVQTAHSCALSKNSIRYYARIVAQKKVEAVQQHKPWKAKKMCVWSSYFNSLENRSENERQKAIQAIESVEPATMSPTDLDSDGTQRLSKYLARLGLCSRRQAVEMIKKGRIKVNGSITTERETGIKISPGDKVYVDDRMVTNSLTRESASQVLLYAFNKPREMLSDRVDSNKYKNRVTIQDELNKHGLGHLMVIGRLDFMSEGLVLLTNDGALKRYMELPSSELERQYLVKIHGRVTEKHLDKFKQGTNIEGKRYGKCVATIHRECSHFTWLRVSLYEGKNREIRKIFQQFNMVVTRLKRIKYGPYELRNTQKKQMRQVECTKELRRFCYKPFEKNSSTEFYEDDEYFEDQ